MYSPFLIIAAHAHIHTGALVKVQSELNTAARIAINAQDSAVSLNTAIDAAQASIAVMQTCPNKGAFLASISKTSADVNDAQLSIDDFVAQNTKKQGTGILKVNRQIADTKVCKSMCGA